MNKNESLINLDTINWFNLNKEGFILSKNNIPLPNILEKNAGVYIYQLLLDKYKVYIGSTRNIKERIAQHRICANNKSKTCPKFYNSVIMHGWNNFRLAILEYIDISKLDLNNKCEIRKAILNREQYYLDKMNPSLNINKKAGSMLGYKHTEEMRKIMSLQRRDVSINWSIKDLSYTISNITK
jgi:group I intron endonuclease